MEEMKKPLDEDMLELVTGGCDEDEEEVIPIEEPREFMYRYRCCACNSIFCTTEVKQGAHYCLQCGTCGHHLFLG